jgi:tetratricopeptide (TPR) repeat protein
MRQMHIAKFAVPGLFLGAVLCLIGGAIEPTAAMAGPHEDCGGVLQSAERAEEAHRAADASSLYNHALTVCERLPDSPVKAIAFNNIGHAYFRLGRFADAQAAATQVLAIRQKTLLPNDPRIAESLTDLGFLDDNMGRFAESEDLLKRAASIQEKVHGPDHPDFAKVVNNLAALYLHLGRFSEAEPLMKHATAIWEKAPAGDNYATSLNNLAVLYGLEGRYAEDESLIRRALALREKLGVDVDASLDNLASLYVAEGRYDDAEPLIKRALEIERKKGAAEPPSLTILGAIYREQHRYPDAEAALSLALSESEKTSGAVFRDVAHSLHNLGGLYSEEGRYTEAEPLLRKAAAIREKSLGADNRYFASDLYALAYVDELQGHNAEAEPILQRALAIQEVSLESDHPDIAKSLDQLASIHETEGKIARALEDSRKAVSILGRRSDQANDDPSDEGAFERKSNRALFARLVHLLWTNAPDRDNLPSEIVDEAFRAAQLAGGADTAKAISGMAARYAAGDDSLAALVRDREDLSNQWKKLDSDLLKSAAEESEKRNALAEAALRKVQADVAAKLNADNDKLRTVFPRFVELAEARPVRVAEVQDVLSPDEAFGAFSLGQSESFLFVIRKADAHMFRLSITSDEATDAVKALRGTLTTDGTFSLSDAHTLYTKLFAAADQGCSVLISRIGIEGRM